MADALACRRRTAFIRAWFVADLVVASAGFIAASVMVAYWLDPTAATPAER
jgi:hypothetical protein